MANTSDLWRDFDRPFSGFGSWRRLLRQLDDILNENMSIRVDEGGRMMMPRCDMTKAMCRILVGLVFALTFVAGSGARAQSFDDPFPLLPRARTLAHASLPGAWLWRIESFIEAIGVESPCQQAGWHFRFRHPDNNRIVLIQAMPEPNHGHPCTRWHFSMLGFEQGSAGQSWGPLEIPEQRASFTAVVARAKRVLGTDGQIIQIGISLEMAEAGQESEIYRICRPVLQP